MAKIKCPICEFEIEDSEISLCPICNAEVTNPANESVILKAHGTLTTEDKQFFGKMGVNIALYLTDKRLLAIPEKLEGYNLSMKLTAGIINKMTSEYGVYSIPFSDIKAVRNGKNGLLGKAIIVDTANGDLLKITVSKQNVWKEKIMKAANLS